MARQFLEPTRMWINQPSTLSPYHKWNGMNVLAYGTRIYFLDGPTISMEAPSHILSKGWREQVEVN
jgi:hypothetical protein